MATKEQMTHEYTQQYMGVSKNDIYDRSFRWIAQNFKSAKEVIDYQDKASGSIIAKGIISDVKYLNNFHLNSIGDLHFTLTIDCRDGKARYVYTNVEMQVMVSNGMGRIGDTQEVHQAADREFQKLNESIAKAVTTKDGF